MRVIITNKQIAIFSNNANNQSITMYPFLVDKKLRVCSVLIISDKKSLVQKGYLYTYITCLLHTSYVFRQRNRTCLKLHYLLWMRTSNVIIHNIAYSGS